MRDPGNHCWSPVPDMGVGPNLPSHFPDRRLCQGCSEVLAPYHGRWFLSCNQRCSSPLLIDFSRYERDESGKLLETSRKVAAVPLL